jgi:two-component system, NtrC family, C4-dicarboxylate transport sensor histidine kinase DctB
MSKMIIEKSLEGELSHKNIDDGSIFIIKLILG